MRIKVCGNTKIDQMHQLGELGIEFAGLIFYEQSPRDVFKSGLTGTDLKRAKIKPYKVGVFVNATYEFIMKQVDNFGLDMVQLHGNETPYFCEKVSNNIQVIKAFRLSGNDHVEWIAKDYYEVVDMFMLDTGVITKNTETNAYNARSFNYNRIKDVTITKPYFLSGGIEATDVQLVKSFMNLPVAAKLFCVDINSRFEVMPGVKDMNKIKIFADELRKE